MNAFIKAISYYLPDKIVTNEELLRLFPEWSVEKVSAKIGVDARHVSAPNETAADMAIKAAEKLFDTHEELRSKIDFILFCTQSPDFKLPTTACLIQECLGLSSNIGALDYNLGCSGYVYGLAMAKGLIMANIACNVLLLTAETYTKYIHPSDKGNRSLFGDGAAATVISTEGWAQIENFVLGTDGTGGENLIVKAGGSRFPQLSEMLNYDDGGYLKAPDFLYMNGSEIFNFTLKAIPPLVKAVIEKNHLDRNNIDYYIFHQANKFMLNTIRKICDLPKDKFYINLQNTGNTVSSTVPIALVDCVKNNKLSTCSNILLAGFGVGYSWGACILKIDGYGDSVVEKI